MKTVFSLPDKPSELLQLALDSLIACENAPDKYVVRMDYWYSPSFHQNGRCTVCFAGAVIAQQLPNLKSELTPGHWRESSVGETSLRPEDFVERTHKKLFALNSFRVGLVKTGFHHMGVSFHVRDWPSREIPAYCTHPVEFKEGIQQLIRDLATKNL